MCIFPVMRILQLLCKQTGPCKTLPSAFSHQSKSLGFDLFKGQHLINNERRRGSCSKGRAQVVKCEQTVLGEFHNIPLINLCAPDWKTAPERQISCLSSIPADFHTQRQGGADRDDSILQGDGTVNKWASSGKQDPGASLTRINANYDN